VQDVLEAIVDPTRRQILGLVWQRELPAGQIAAHFRVSRPAISKHLRVLHRAGLLAERRDGTQRIYRARPERLAEVRQLLENFWEHALSDVKTAAERR
jgi:DNA-binding transcriptional ArsR family regulator